MTTHHFTFHITDQSDASDIREVETRAFGFSKEADLVASLLEDESARPALSLLARHEDKAVGHILFTRATCKDATDVPLMHILAPLAVIPEYQGMGVGRLLIRTGIEHLRLMGCQMVFVLGHATYYPKHGFEPCRRQRLPSTLSHSRGTQGLLDDAITLCSANPLYRPHSVRAGLDETGALA